MSHSLCCGLAASCSACDSERSQCCSEVPPGTARDPPSRYQGAPHHSDISVSYDTSHSCQHSNNTQLSILLAQLHKLKKTHDKYCNSSVVKFPLYFKQVLLSVNQYLITAMKHINVVAKIHHKWCCFKIDRLNVQQFFTLITEILVPPVTDSLTHPDKYQLNITSDGPVLKLKQVYLQRDWPEPKLQFSVI